MSTDSRHQIETALQAFSDAGMHAASIGLLSALGYQSEKTLDLSGSPESFIGQFDNNPDRAFRKDNALFDDWKETHLLFQLTDQELSGQDSLFTENKVKQGLMSSYLFFALRLKGESCPRGKLAQITRQLNRLFPMPVMVMFEYNGKLSIAVINRRRSKRDADKDVLGKVTFIQDISLASPHRGHLDILGSFSLSALAGRTGIHSFDALHGAWEEIFNVGLLNRKFYRELSNWYFWAMQHVHFPFDGVELDKSELFRQDEKIREHDAKNIIRLLTRLLFVWFIKEKGLIPEPLFNPDNLGQVFLKDFDACSRDTRFYKAILQNLFFATLNQTCGKRQFRNQGRQHRNITTLMRYQRYFQNPDTFLEMVESVVPFMNGGLFECLDKVHPTSKGPQGGDVILNELWRDRQIGKVNNTIAVAEQIDDTTIRENTVKELEAQKLDIEEAFSNNDLGYGRKLYLIENCIYGIDIQSIATQISKLRFFISLIVEQGADLEKDNFGIRPLPNLETKFTTADTLIRVEKTAAQGELFESEKVKALEKELKQIRHSMFNAKTPKTKRKYRLRDKELREQIAGELEDIGWSTTTARQLSQWDPYDQNASSPFFDAEWMYGITDGFDVVIGNPPYVQIQKFSKAQKAKWVAQNYQTYAATADIYCLFYERGAHLLRTGGHLCFITSNKWMRAGYGDKLRAFLSSTVDTMTVLDFGMAQNFGAATTYTCILSFENRLSTKRTRSCYAADDKAAMAAPEKYFRENSVYMPELSESSWVVVTPERYRIKKAVEEQGIPLEEWDLSINYGIKTGFNDAFYLTQEQRDELVAKEPQAEDIIVPLLRGRYVERYGHSWDRTWMINSHNGVKNLDMPPVNVRDDYPVLFTHLKQWEKELIKRQDKGCHWTNLRNCAYIEAFGLPKIIYQDIAIHMPFLYDETDRFFFNNTCWMMTGELMSLPYLTAVFNSSLFRFCFRDNFPEYSGNACRMFAVFFEKIPIKRPDASKVNLFETLVNYVQFVKAAANQSTSNGTPPAVVATFLEELIDACVMEVYFSEHMAEKKLTVITEVDKTIKPFPKTAADSAMWQQVQSFYDTVNSPKHPIRNRLMRIPIDSPDLLRVIKEEGKV